MPKIAISEIKVGDRYRRRMGDIKTLAASIKKLGLLQPIGITMDRTLIFGERRLRACRDVLKMDEIDVRIVNVPSMVEAENDENEVRLEFTPSERVSIAAAIGAEIGERRGRPSNDATENPQDIAEIPKGQETRDFATENVGKRPQFEVGEKTGDFAAKKAGFGSRRTFERAKSVVENAEPELVDAMDSGKVSILAAHRATKLEPEVQREIAKHGKPIPEYQRQDDAFRRKHYDRLTPRRKTQAIMDMVGDIARCNLTAEEFTQHANRTVLEQLRRFALPVIVLLQNLTETNNGKS